MVKKRILLVDDDPDILDAYNDFFEMEGFKTTKACDGAEAIKILVDQTFDLVVTDVRMPNATGIDLYESIRKSKPNLPVIFVSAYSDITMNSIRKDHFAWVLQKPVPVEFLHERVQEFLKTK